MHRFLLIFAIGLIMTYPLFAEKNGVYDCLNVESVGIEKISADMVISRPIGQFVLSQVARTVYKALKGPRFKRVFITWYLPGMEVGAGAWATTHFNPLLEVTIMTWMLEHNPPTSRIYAE